MTCSFCGCANRAGQLLSAVYPPELGNPGASRLNALGILQAPFYKRMPWVEDKVLVGIGTPETWRKRIQN